MPDFYPSLCALAGVPIPRTVEGRDLSEAGRGGPVDEQEALLLMNFSRHYDWFKDGTEWRGVRTKTATYTTWLDGRTELFDLTEDPLQPRNLADDPDYQAMAADHDGALRAIQKVRGDELVPSTQWANWLDEQRRVVRNVFGKLSHPESTPDWSLLQ